MACGTSKGTRKPYGQASWLMLPLGVDTSTWPANSTNEEALHHSVLVKDAAVFAALLAMAFGASRALEPLPLPSPRRETGAGVLFYGGLLCLQLWLLLVDLVCLPVPPGLAKNNIFKSSPVGHFAYVGKRI